MTPELPKVELPGAVRPKGEILDSLEKAYQLSEEVGGVESKDVSGMGGGKTSEDLAKVGSVGLEAGLTNFELTKDDSSAGAGSTDDDASTADPAALDAQDVDPVKARVGGAKAVKVPAVAEDKDDIEKEWVNKAKKIVEQTKTDPYLQERAVSRLQADYMKKRFNKDVKLPKEEA
ncbi:MAG: hypothetical protein QG623_596 [Patescibacteria group bacterium]|nr:hypothetical protein [Patescibacteria group bacterium]